MNKLFSKWPTDALLVAAFAAMVFTGLPARADSVPDWFRQLAHAPLGKYAEESKAVVLLDDQTLTVKDNGDIYITVRRALKILRPNGKEYGLFGVSFDKEKKIESIHAWSISNDGHEYELKEKDAVDASPISTKHSTSMNASKFLKLPGVDTGAYVAVEYQQRCRPYNFSRRWYFQEEIPVKTARFSTGLAAWLGISISLRQLDRTETAECWRKQLAMGDARRGRHRRGTLDAGLGIAGGENGRQLVLVIASRKPHASQHGTMWQVGPILECQPPHRHPRLQAKVTELIAGKTDTLV